MGEKLLRFALLVGVFVLAWFSIVAAVVGAAFVWVILLTIYESGGARALLLTAVIIAAFVALLITLRKRREAPELVTWFKAKPRKERWALIVTYVLAGAVLLKGGWNIATDPSGSIRYCVWCSLEQPYKPPPR
ncbi:MAG TPA: hypothetical protein VH913_17085 [Hyphomicrobiaceae bacterium]|jgi:hypothetical protein